jgi:Ca2+-binding EF-hand superfamily protein
MPNARTVEQTLDIMLDTVVAVRKALLDNMTPEEIAEMIDGYFDENQDGLVEFRTELNRLGAERGLLVD